MPSDSELPSTSSTPFAKAITAIDAAHSLDPRSHRTLAGGLSIPYELHYAQRMTHFTQLLCASPSEALQLAVRAQHFRRWEVPRSSYPMTKAGYYSWRGFLARRQAEQAAEVCAGAGVTEEVVRRMGALIRKEGLRDGDEEVQVLEDAACLVFLDEQLEEFEKGVGSEEKVVEILRKTWRKMGVKGREVAMGMEMGERAKELVMKALEESAASGQS